MATLDKTSDRNSFIETSEKNYKTLEKIDFTDIAQAIDGTRSKPKDDAYYKKASNESVLKPKKFWSW